MAFVDLEKAFDHISQKSGLCDWCRGCMQMRGAKSMLVRGTVKFEVKVGVHQAQYSALFIIVLEALS